MNNPGKDKILASLIEKFSISEIISILSEIDEKIISIHKCSSEDFLKLNDHLKKFHKNSKDLSNNASEILNIITGKDKSNFYKELISIHDKFKEIIQSIENNINHHVHDLDNIYTQFEILFVPLNNYKQNLQTMKLLLTNLQLGDSISKDNNMGMPSTSIINEINIIKEKYTFFDQKLSTIKNKISKTLDEFNKIKGNNTKNLELFLNQILSSINLLSSKYDMAKVKIPLLTEKTTNTSNNIGSIITNLQYHDIIRQKIEHIQLSHKNIIDELNNLDLVEEENHVLQDKLKAYIQIRDIAGLQAAQLIHANQQYQSAIEEITNKFQEIGKDMYDISGLCRYISGSGNASQNLIFNKILSNLEDASNITEKLFSDNKFLKESLLEINQELQDITDTYQQVKNTSHSFYKNLGRIISMPSKDKTEKNNISQIKALSGELNKAKNNAAKILEYSLHLSGNPSKMIHQEADENLFTKTLGELKEQVHQVLNGIGENGQMLFHMVEENNSISMQVGKTIKNIIKEIKYYDFFDKKVEEIILELNSINEKLNTDFPLSEQERSSNLEELKKLYTMNSEYIIHDKITGNGSINNNSHEDEHDKDEDNLELF
ncbi:MAG: hypothetical protein ACOCUL_00325 [Bacteroidota bacterium]